MTSAWLAAVAFATAGCYDPMVRDCTVTCAGSGDCAHGQACAGGYCVAAGELAATCSPGDKPDANVAAAALHVVVMGSGRVDVDGALSCTTDCMFQIAVGVSHELIATPDSDHDFQMWSGACGGGGATCSLTLPAMPAMPSANVGAKFGGGGG